MNSQIKRHLKDKRGISLFEILLSVALLGLLVASFLSVFGSSFSTIHNTGNKDKAIVIGSEILESIYPYQELGFESKQEIIDILDGENGVIQRALNGKDEFYVEYEIEELDYVLVGDDSTRDENITEGFVVKITTIYGTREPRITVESFYKKLK